VGRDSGSGQGWEGPDDDDWFADKGELDWQLDDPRENPAAVSGVESAARGQGHDAGARRVGRAGPQRSEQDSRRATRAIIARRQILALLTVGLVVVAVVAVVVATSGGSRSTKTTLTASTQATSKRTTGTAASSVQPTRPVQTQPTPTSALAKVTLPASGKLSNGDSGSAVETLQKALISLGYKLGTPDGNFGSATQAAVSSFQTAHGLTPDGIVGATTAQKLNALLASRTGRG
jgi:putative peptidoglycan binding protein